MIHSQEFVSKYAGKNTAQTLQEIINHEYNTPVNSPGVDQLAAKIDSGQTTLAQLLAAPGLVTQPSALANKVGEALHFTHRVEELHLENGYSGDAAIAVASQWIHLIGIDSASVSIAEASLDSAIYASVAAHG